MITTTNRTSTTPSSALSQATNSHQNPKGALGKDDFMKLLLVELQYQDPTEPMDTEKILSQTSQLATLESADNTNNALKTLSEALKNSQQFSTISAIGKTASLGSDMISHTKDSNSRFEVYFPNDIKSGTVSIKDSHNRVVRTLNIPRGSNGVHSFTWDGKDQSGHVLDTARYHVSANYTDSHNSRHETQLGVYPIESVKFDRGKALVKLGSSYVPIENVKEVF